MLLYKKEYDRRFRKTKPLPEYTVYIFQIIKWKEAYNYLIDLWNKGYRSYDYRQLLMSYQCPIVWKYYMEDLLPSMVRKMTIDSKFCFYQGSCLNIRYEQNPETNLTLYDIDIYIENLGRVNEKGWVFYCSLLGEDESIICPFNIGMLLSISYIRDLLMKSEVPTVKRIMSKLFINDVDPLNDCEKKTPLYHISKKELRNISKEISNNKESFREALQPLIDSIEKRDEWWKKDMPYYNETH